MLSDEDYVEPTKQVLKDCFGIEEETVDSLIEDSPDSRYSVLVKGIDYETAQKFNEIDEDDENYPMYRGSGWRMTTRGPTPTAPWLPTCWVYRGRKRGKRGHRGYYNSTLNGTDGREYGYLDSGSSVERTVKEPVNGKTVVSTIDLQVQSVVEKYIQQFNDERKNNATPGRGARTRRSWS